MKKEKNVFTAIVRNISGNYSNLMSNNSISFIELQDKTNLSYSALYNLIADKNSNPTLKTLVTISNILDISLEDTISPESIRKKIPILTLEQITQDIQNTQSNFAIFNTEKWFKELPTSSILYFKKFNNVAQQLQLSDQRMVMLVDNTKKIQLKQILLDNNQIFVKTLDKQIPTRLFQNSDIVIAFFTEIYFCET